MPKRTGDSLTQRVVCDTCDWYWKKADASDGLSSAEKWCPRCEETKLVVFRGADLIGVTTLQGRDTGSYVEALREVGAEAMSQHEVHQLLRIARARAEAGLLHSETRP